ncbi:M61 family metallopeptidase [Thauera sinica]|uniref:M61 family metallopeptidase n=1 Tax=Thauera sinica TaxID=2665146 RepID=A0ABW1ATB3_9RHOO|nr:PDZ domain-containing protein [Thauera sp. K11]ATE59949.1 peptidase M61 [Thauera sp. K11]
MPNRLPPVRYRIRPHRPEAHLFEVDCIVADPDPAGQVFRLPAWIPGSYMIREFARNIVSLAASADGKPVPVVKLDKHSWRVRPVPRGAALTLTYEVYAWDLSVRAAHLDTTHGFFNGTSVFVAAEGKQDRPCLVDIERPDGSEYRDWRVVTALSRARDAVGAAWQYGFGRYQANGYDELIDHPVEMGRFTLAHFEAGGVRHDVALTGRHDCDTERLTADLRRICNWQIDLFGAPPPMDYYAFLTMVVGDGYGGLEHRASTALLASRADLPWKGMQGMPDGYKGFLGLCSHEYFHSWNVKRIKPAAFTPYELAAENYTRLLWAFEGFTSYYDDLALVRSGVIALEDYLGLLGKTISNVLRTPGRLKQSVAESSFDAWIKYYRQDENSPNAIVSYYAKGALIALALDLQLRAATSGRASLDDVMRLLWQRHGQTGAGVEEDGIFAAVAEIAASRGSEALGGRLSRWLRLAVEGTDDLPLPRLLKSFGIDHRAEPGGKGPTLGIKLGAGGGEARIANVFEGGAAQRAGLSAGDVLVALDGLRVSASNLDPILARHAAGDEVDIHAFRRDELMRFRVELAGQPADSVTLKLVPRPSAGAAQLRRGWLGG